MRRRNRRSRRLRGATDIDVAKAVSNRIIHGGSMIDPMRDMIDNTLNAFKIDFERQLWGGDEQKKT